MAEMFDSDTASYPDGVQYIAAYVDGSRTGRNYAIASSRNPGAKFLLISAVGDADADVIDIESGNVWPPANAVDWTVRQRSLGKNPGYYCNTSTRQQVLDAYAARGVDPGWWWRADYRDPSERPASFALGELAHQYADPPMTGGHWDASVIAPALQAYLDGNASALSGNPTPIEDDLVTDAQYNQLRADIGYARDQIMFGMQENQPFRLYHLLDTNVAPERLGWISLARPGFIWHIPDGNLIPVLQHYRLAGAIIDVNTDAEFQLIEMAYGLGSDAAANQQIIDAISKLKLPTAVTVPMTAQEIVSTLQTAITPADPTQVSK